MEAEQVASKQLNDMASEMAAKAENVKGVAHEVDRLEVELQSKEKEIAEKVHNSFPYLTISSGF